MAKKVENERFPVPAKGKDDTKFYDVGLMGRPTSAGPQTAFEGASNVDVGETRSDQIPVEGNRFPREKGSDSLTETEAQLA